MEKPDPIPIFFLYGEAPRAVSERFLHVESLDDRSRPSNWNIRPHAHAELNHLFFIAKGGGEMRADTVVTTFKAPCLLLIPTRVVHGFTYEIDTGGAVLTISEAYLRDLIAREQDFLPLFDAASVVPLHNIDAVETRFEQLRRELAWTAPGHFTAVEALLNGLLVEAIRMTRGLAHELAVASHGAPARLVARFREMVEMRYRSDDTVADYARALAVTPKQLRSACVKMCHCSPVQIIQERLLLESKRLMLYSNMAIAEMGYYLGFGDPAYFSRFFAKRVGVSPRMFRSSTNSI